MIMKICTIYDAKGEAFFQPMFFQSVAQAERSFQDATAKPDSDIGMHPEDYSLFLVGEFDQRTGQITVLEARVAIAVGVPLSGGVDG